METLNSIMSDYAFLSATMIFIITLVALIGLKILNRKTGVPTQDIEEVVQVINEQAKQDLVKIVTTSYRDPKTGKFVSAKQKVLPANKNTPSGQTEEDEKEDKEASKPLTKGAFIPILLLFLLPIASCAPGFLKTGYKMFTDNVEITLKDDGTEPRQPIDSILIKSNPIYWKEVDSSYFLDSAESEAEFIKDGYRVWQLRTPNWKRFEVQRLDTVIYIYKK